MCLADWRFSRLLVYRSKNKFRQSQTNIKNPTQNTGANISNSAVRVLLEAFWLHSSCSVLLCPFLLTLCLGSTVCNRGMPLKIVAVVCSWMGCDQLYCLWWGMEQLHVNLSHCPPLGWPSTTLFLYQTTSAVGESDSCSEQGLVGQISGLNGW